MNPSEVTSPLVIYALTSAVGVIGVLVSVIWIMMRAEVKSNMLALDKKASSRALEEVKKEGVEALAEAKRDAGAALKDVKTYFTEAQQRQHQDYQDRLKVLTEKQDREIDWLKSEMDKLSTTLIEMRRESNLANSDILRHLRTLAGGTTT